MFFTKATLATVLSALALASAAPSGTLGPRTCSVRTPNTIGFPIHIDISKDASVSPPIESKPFLSFTIPDGSFGCQLVATFPPAFDIESSGNPQVTVRAVGGPAPGADVGTITFASDPLYPTRRVINSFACRTDMQFQFEIASEQSGEVSFYQPPGFGLNMEFNC